MQLHLVAEASGYLGSVLGVSMVIPQILLTYRNRALPGVSAMSWALTALSCLTWLLYGVRTGEVPQIPGNVFMVSGAAVVVLAVPSAASTGRRTLGLLAGGGALGALAFVLPSAAIGGVGFAIGLISGLPQLTLSLTRRRGDSAISLLTWVLRAASQACWLFYALVVGDPVVAVSAAFLLTSAALVLVVELVRQPAATPASVPVLAPVP